MTRSRVTVLLATVLGLVVTTPVAATRAAWNDTATTAAQLQTVTAAPVLSCQPNGANATVSWSQPQLGTSFAPVTYTATIKRGTNGTTSPLAVSGTAPNFSVPVTGQVTLVTVPVLVTVTGTLGQTSWTAATPMTLQMTGLLNGWQMVCP